MNSKEENKNITYNLTQNVTSSNQEILVELISEQ